jgi:hypothetical protein
MINNNFQALYHPSSLHSIYKSNIARISMALDRQARKNSENVAGKANLPYLTPLKQHGLPLANFHSVSFVSLHLNTPSGPFQP